MTRRDPAEKGIRQALEKVGATVIPVPGKGHPDLFVFYQGQWWAAAVKRTGGIPTTAPIWRTPDDALRAIGALR